MIGRIDVHSHLLPGVDDGCQDVAESVACARKMVAAGYTHSFCTPHIQPIFDNSVKTVTERVSRLQGEFDRADVPLKLMPGGEMNFSSRFCQTDPKELVTYNNVGRYAIFDFWADTLPDFFIPCLKKLRDEGIQPILAHPERISVFINEPQTLDKYLAEGLLIQCNLEPLGDAHVSDRRALAERWLIEDRYFLLGSDLHRLNTLDHRLRGLERAIELIGEDEVWTLTHTNPLKLMA